MIRKMGAVTAKGAKKEGLFMKISAIRERSTVRQPAKK